MFQHWLKYQGQKKVPALTPWFSAVIQICRQKEEVMRLLALSHTYNTNRVQKPTGCPPHQRWFSFSRVRRLKVALNTGSCMVFPTIPWDSG